MNIFSRSVAIIYGRTQQNNNYATKEKSSRHRDTTQKYTKRLQQRVHNFYMKIVASIKRTSIIISKLISSGRNKNKTVAIARYFCNFGSMASNETARNTLEADVGIELYSNTCKGFRGKNVKRLYSER